MKRNYDHELLNSTRYNKKRGYKKTDYDTNSDRALTLGILIAMLVAAFIILY